MEQVPSLIHINNNANDANSGVIWRNVEISRNTSNNKSLKGIYVRLAATHSGLFETFDFITNTFVGSSLEQAIRIESLGINSSFSDIEFLSNFFELTKSNSTAILWTLSDSSTTTGGGASVVDVTIRNQTAQFESPIGIHFDAKNGSPHIQNLIIRNNPEINATKTAIWLDGQKQSMWSGVAIHDNGNITSEQTAGILIEAKGDSTWSSIDITGNTTIGSTDSSDANGGIYLLMNSGATIDSFNVSNNGTIAGSNHGIKLEVTAGTPTINNITISGNTRIEGLSNSRAIYATVTSNTAFSGITIQNNPLIKAGGAGIDLNLALRENPLTLLIHNNALIDSDGDGVRVAIGGEVLQVDTTITNNNIDSEQDGVSVSSSINSPLIQLAIQNNTINGDDDGIVLSATASSTWNTTIENNSIQATDDGVVITTNSTSIWDTSIINNTQIQAGSRSVDLRATANASFTYLIENNSGVAAGTDGIRLSSTGASAWSGLIQNNRLTGSGDRGIVVDYHSSTINSGLQILNNQIAYDIGLLADSFDIVTVTNVRSNTFTSSEWFIKDIHPDLTTYIDIRKGQSGTTNNTYSNAFISFLDDRDPNGIRPGDQFNVWNETQFYGFLAEVTSNDNPQFQLAVDNVLAQENDVIRINNRPFNDFSDGTFKTSDYENTDPNNANGNDWNGYSFKLDTDVIITDLVGSFALGGGGGRVAIFSANVVNGNPTNPKEQLAFVDIVGTTRNTQVTLATPLKLSADTWYYIAQVSSASDVFHRNTNTFNVSTLISNSVISAWGPNTGSSSHNWANTDINSSILNVTPNTRSDVRPAVGFVYEVDVQYDVSNIDINTSGLRIYSSGVNSSGNPIEPAKLRNIPQTGVTAQSGVIFNINAPGVTIEYLSFKHGFDTFELNETGGFGVIQVFTSNTTLSGLQFIADETQSTFAIAIRNGQDGFGHVDNTLIQSVTIGSGSTGASYRGGIGLLAQSGTATITNVTIQSGFIHTTGDSDSIGVAFLSNQLHQISGVSIRGNTFDTNDRGIFLQGSGVSTITIEQNIFDSNGIHVDDSSSPATFVSLRNEILVDNGNTFGPAVNANAFVNNALVVGNTITSAQQNFINVEKLEAYTTLQAAINDALEGQTIKVRSNATFSDATLSSTNSGTVIVNVSGLTITSVNPPNLATIRNTDASDAPVFDLRASGITITNIAITRNSGVITSSGTGAVQINNQFITLSGIQFNSDNGFEFISPANATLLPSDFADRTSFSPSSSLAYGWSGYAFKISEPTYVSGIIASVAASGISTLPSGAFQAAFFTGYENSDGTLNFTSGIQALVPGSVVSVINPSQRNATEYYPTFEADSANFTEVRIPLGYETPLLLQPGWYYIAQGITTEQFGGNNGLWPFIRGFDQYPDHVEQIKTTLDFIDDIYNVPSAANGNGDTATRIIITWFADNANPLYVTAEQLASSEISPFLLRSGMALSTNDERLPVLGFEIVKTQPIDSDGLNNSMNAIGYNNSGVVQDTSGLVISNNTFEGTWASMIEFVNVFDNGVIEATIHNNAASGTRFNNRFGESTSGVIRFIALDDILVRLDAFDTVTLTSNTFGSSGIDKTLIPIFDVLSFNNLGSTVTTATGLTSGLYTTATWNLVETALALPERTNIDNQNKLAQLTAALSGLVLQASFDALEAEINFSSGLLQADFITSTYNTFSGVFATSSGLLNTHSDTTVDNSGIVQATTDLINAMIQLEFASEATLSGLVNITTSGLDTSNYTDPTAFVTTRTSGIELLEQISTSGVKAFFENDFVRLNEIVSGVSNDLQTRLNELVFINFSGLQVEVNVVSGLLESNFEADQWSAFDTARTSGLTINTNVTNSGALAFFDGVALTSGTILDITNAIETARLNLAFSGFEVLSGLVNITTSGLDSANYTAVTFDPFTTVRNSGILIVDAVRTSGALAVFEASPLSSGVITSITNELTTRFNALGFNGLEELSGLVNITTSGLIENDHTVETWSIFNAARTSGIGILDAVRTSGAVAVFDGSPITPTVINNVSSSLQAAFSGLILQTSYDALEAEINFSSGLEEADFVNFETFSGAFAFGSGLLNTQANTDVTNSGILDATSGLINAMLQLEFSGQEALSGLLNITSGLDTSNFIDPDLYITTRSSGLELLDLISTSGVKAFYEEAFVRSNTVVSGLTTDLETQLSGLVFINFSGLLTEVNLVSGLVESNFEADEWPAFAQALNSGLTINTNVTNSGALAFFEGVTSGLILDVTTALNTARGALVFTNFAGLQAEVNLVSGLVASNFTPDTWNPFNSALTSGLTINTNVTNSGALAIFNEIPLTSGVIFDITTSLQETRSNLVYQGFVELSGLVNGDTSGLVASNFTENTWTAFNNARTSGLDVLSAIESSGAVAVFEGITLTSGTITTITATLQDAYDALDFIGYAELSGLVQLVEPLDASNFTDPAAFEAARTSGVLITTAVEASGAIAIFDDVRLTSGVITTVFNALNDTTSGLVFHNFDTLSGLINVTTSGIDLSNFTQEAVDAFTIARTSGLNLYNNIVASGVFATEEGTFVTSGLIDTINISMQHAYGVLGQSFLGFDVLINEVNISSGLEESNFKDPNIPASWTTFTISLQDAENLIQAINGSGVIAVDPKQTSEVVTSGLIDQIINSLVTARTNLVFNEYPELVTLVDVTTSGLDLSNFEDTTAFEAAQSSGLDIIQVVTDSGALAVFESVSLTSGAIRVVIDALETAYGGLVYFNYNDLVSTLELYSGLNELDFTPETWSTFDVARDVWTQHSNRSYKLWRSCRV
jgi:hypothetical protein